VSLKIRNPSTLAEIDSQSLFERATLLQHEYESDLSASLPLQMVSFQDSMQGEIAKVKKVKQLAHMLIIENASVSSGFADVVTALILFLTIPASVARVRITMSYTIQYNHYSL